MKYFIKFSSYLAAYHGLQIQEKAITVQSKMAEPLHFYARLNEIHTGCSQTNTGVHT